MAEFCMSAELVDELGSCEDIGLIYLKLESTFRFIF